jgi:hypothetical protein
VSARSRRIRRQHRKWGKPWASASGSLGTTLVRFCYLDEVISYPNRYTTIAHGRNLGAPCTRLRWVPIDFGPDRTLDGMMAHHSGPIEPGGVKRWGLGRG